MMRNILQHITKAYYSGTRHDVIFQTQSINNLENHTHISYLISVPVSLLILDPVVQLAESHSRRGTDLYIYIYLFIYA